MPRGVAREAALLIQPNAAYRSSSTGLNRTSTTSAIDIVRQKTASPPMRLRSALPPAASPRHRNVQVRQVQRKTDGYAYSEAQARESIYATCAANATALRATAGENQTPRARHRVRSPRQYTASPSALPAVLATRCKGTVS